MSMYLNAFLMLFATVAAFLILAKLAQALRERRLSLPWQIDSVMKPSRSPSRLVVEQSCMVDAKRRLVLIRFDQNQVLLLTGGPSDLIVSVIPAVGTDTGA